MPREEDSHIEKGRSKPHPSDLRKNYWPASSLAVIKPILSMPAPRMMSINGTTLGDESAPPFSPPTSIPIASLLWAWDRAAPQAVKPCRVGSGAALRNQQTNGTTESTIFNPRTADEEGTLHSGSSG